MNVETKVEKIMADLKASLAANPIKPRIVTPAVAPDAPITQSRQNIQDQWMSMAPAFILRDADALRKFLSVAIPAVADLYSDSDLQKQIGLMELHGSKIH